MPTAEDDFYKQLATTLTLDEIEVIEWAIKYYFSDKFINDSTFTLMSEGAENDIDSLKMIYAARGKEFTIPEPLPYDKDTINSVLKRALYLADEMGAVEVKNNLDRMGAEFWILTGRGEREKGWWSSN